MVAKLKTTKNSKQARKKQPEKQAAATVFRVICLFAAVGILVLDATIVTFDYPVWVLGLIMGVVIGLGPEDLKDWFKGRGK
jgi:Na+/glutamate symporter